MINILPFLYLYLPYSYTIRGRTNLKEAKVIFLGSTNVGKTTILGTYRDGTFLRQTNLTLGIDKITIKHSPELTIQVYI